MNNGTNFSRRDRTREYLSPLSQDHRFVNMLRNPKNCAGMAGCKLPILSPLQLWMKDNRKSKQANLREYPHPNRVRAKYAEGTRERSEHRRAKAVLAGHGATARSSLTIA
jgi:hypothetical protein